VMMGTPAFMAPEQALAESSKIDAQTDLWAVGATLFTLLAGELVHEGENASQLLVNAATKKARSIASIVGDVPGPVAAVIDKALAFEKGERWASAKEMREALRAACLEGMGAGIAPLPKRAGVTGFEATMAPEEGSVSGSASGDVGFDATVEAKSGESGPATDAAVSRSRNDESERHGRRIPWRRIAAFGAACAAVAGAAYAYRAARAPRVRYCLAVEDTKDGPRCAFEVGADILGKRHRTISRVTEVAGHVVTVERVNFAGLPIDDYDRNTHRRDVVRDDGGVVREILERDPHGVITSWEKWSEGGARIDLVDIDGKTPRHESADSRATTIRLEYDARGRRKRARFFGPTGRPRLTSDDDFDGADTAAYGFECEYGKTPVTCTKRAYLRADGTPGATASGVATLTRSDDGTPWGQDLRLFDLEGHPYLASGFWHLHLPFNGYEQDGWAFFGLGEEPVSGLKQSFHEARNTWDPQAHVWEGSVFDERGRPQVVRDQWFSVIRFTFDARGHLALKEFLDAQGNRVIWKNDAAAHRSSYDEHDNEATLEYLDPSGALMPQGEEGCARVEWKHDGQGHEIEERCFDESGHAIPARGTGAIERSGYDDRGLRVTWANLDAAGRPMPDAHGVSSSHYKYDRMRNRVERAYFGADGKPTMRDDGFAIQRWTYDENDDLVASSYFDASGAPTMFEGEYATERMKNDERGLVVEQDYRDGQGEPVLRKGGYASIKRTRDRNGDVVLEAYFGRRGEPIARDGGYAAKKTTYDIHRRAVEVALLDMSGHAIVGADGWSVERTTYDERGLIGRLVHLDATGSPALDKSGRASLQKSYDSRGNLVEETSLGVDDKPVIISEGYATKKTSYNGHDEVAEEALFGADGLSTIGKAGWSLRRVRHDDFGDVVEEAFLDTTHRPIVPKQLSYASTRQRFDERHRLVEATYLDVGGAPARGPEGAAVVRYKRDAYGRAIETAYFDGATVATASKDGTTVARSRYDDAGRLIEEHFTDASNAPHPATDGCAGHATKYDPQGHKTEESCLAVTDGVALSTSGWAIRRTIRDARGNAVDVSTYGSDAALHADKEGVARRKSRFDERNLVQETTYFDASDKPTHDTHGVASVRFTYDDSGKKTGEASVNEHGQPVRTKPQH
jgi:YD repeat-containing protein